MLFTTYFRAAAWLPFFLLLPEHGQTTSPPEACIADGECQGSTLLQHRIQGSKVALDADSTAEVQESMKVASEVSTGRTRADDAFFLMQATFGQTSDSIDALSGMEYADWIHDQMEVPAGLHREYFRERVNPRAFQQDIVDSGAVALERVARCDAGSMWSRFAFLYEDVGKSISTDGTSVLVDGVFRTHIDPSFTGNDISAPDTCTRVSQGSWHQCSDTSSNWRHRCEVAWIEDEYCQVDCYNAGYGYRDLDCSVGWPSLTFNGYICSVEEGIGGRIIMDTVRMCDGDSRQLFTVMKNPGLLVEGGNLVGSTGTFTTAHFSASIMTLVTPPVTCNHDDGEFVSANGKAVRYYARYAVKANTVDNPTAVVHGKCASSEKNFLNEDSCIALSYTCLDVEGHEVHKSFVCGSPGEVASAAEYGNQFAYTVGLFDGDDVQDRDAEPKFDKQEGPRHSKGWVWTMKAVRGEDQLRQRMAWALSQIVVASEAAFSSWCSEIWIHFYDIFVRHAFGNYRDVLREVTYSPIMAKYLTYRNSRAFDSAGTYADENYAREIMQLFTIGLWMLHPNGTQQLDADGAPIPTYTNYDIMDFARVFTGLTDPPERANIEIDRHEVNWIDPVVMQDEKHDVYPKMNLYGGYLSDGYPLCAEMPDDLFLSEGATYDLVSIDEQPTTDETLVHVEEGSVLFEQLCRNAMLPCNFLPKVTLAQAVTCHGVECMLVASNLPMLVVGNGYFRFRPPTCAHFYFWSEGHWTRYHDIPFSYASGYTCRNPALPLAVASCCAGCDNVAPSGWLDKGKDCINQADSRFQKNCNNKQWWRNEGFCAQRCWELGIGYGADCSAGEYREEKPCTYPRELVTYRDAVSKCQALNMTVCTKQTAISTECNHAQDPRLDVWTDQICHPEDLRITHDGLVTFMVDDYTSRNPVRVAWDAGAFPSLTAPPAGCVVNDATSTMDCPFEVQLQAAFQSVPTAEELERELYVGAFRPSEGCVICDGNIKVFGKRTSFDTDTIFEYRGRFYKNVISRVVVEGFSFRNPTHFMLRDFRSERAALADIEALLDHLTNHPNTAPFIARRLIQHFVTSTPSPEYIYDVAQAFHTGSYDGTVYSGQHGDLAASIAAVLLHPEARGSTTHPSTTGKLREPVVKLMHALRAMDFVGRVNQGIFFRSDAVVEATGQYPYNAPRVFNFFLPDHMPLDTIEEVYAPEFEIFTPPYMIGWMNGIFRLIEEGSSNCNSGWGMKVGETCGNINMSAGFFTFSERATIDETIAELDVLLTGGRLGASAAAVRDAYDNAEDGHKLQAAQKAILLSPEFHTLGKFESISTRGASPHEEEGGGASPAPTPAPAPPSADYKAMIFLFLRGGMDSFNMVIPRDCGLVDEYLTTRTVAAIDPAVSIPITATNQPCSSFGIHPALPFMQTLYEEGSLAFAANVGNMPQPTTKEQVMSKTAKLCSNLFSHSDQWAQAHSMACQKPIAKNGFGGQMADALTSRNYSTHTYSLEGNALWPRGHHTVPTILDHKSGVVSFYRAAEDADLMWNISKQVLNNAYAEAYSSRLVDGVREMEDLAQIVSNATPITTIFNTQGTLSSQLYHVAQLVSTHEARRVDRDLFYVEFDGWDHHADEGGSYFEELLDEVNSGLQSFVTEMQRQGFWDNIAIVSGSDFGRTLTSNGQGTDHSWAGHGFLMGGQVRGGNIYNEFPMSLLEGSEQDLGRGRLLPKYPLESIYVPVAEWMGITGSDLDTVFPNLRNFNATRDIVPVQTLFV